jgi:hypothetical protein
MAEDVIAKINASDYLPAPGTLEDAVIVLHALIAERQR